MRSRRRDAPRFSVARRPPVLLILVARPPAPDLIGLICRAMLGCDVRARLLIFPARSFLIQGRTMVHLLGVWNCPRRRVLDTLTSLFCQEAFRHA